MMTLGKNSQAYPKYPKQQVYNIFAISQGKHEEWSWFFACWWTPKVSSKWCYHFRCVWPDMPNLPKIKSLLFLCNILRKKWVMKLVFCMQITMKICCKLILWFWCGWSSISKVPKVASLQCLYNISKKKLEMMLIFCKQINTKVSDKLISTLWSSKFLTRWHNHYCWPWSSILKVLKVTILKYVYKNITKKKLGMEIKHFCVQMNIKVTTSWHYCFSWKWLDMPKVPKVGSW